MRFLVGVVALAVSLPLMQGCAGGDPAAKDTSAVEGSAALRDERGSAMSGAAATSDSGAEGAASAEGGPPTALILGTSLTAGLGLDPNDAYPAELQRMADSAGFSVRIVNGGLSGETSAGALRRLQWILRDGARLVVVETGANDGLRGLDPDSTRANLTAIVRAIKTGAPGASIVLVQMEAPPNLGATYTRKFHDMYGEVAKREGVQLAPFLLDKVAGVSRLNQADGIHPTAEGAKIVARNLWPVLAPHFQGLSAPSGAAAR